jgi:hypothetical protein
LVKVFTFKDLINKALNSKITFKIVKIKSKKNYLETTFISQIKWCRINLYK